jgi:hypothetical protein
VEGRIVAGAGDELATEEAVRIFGAGDVLAAGRTVAVSEDSDRAAAGAGERVVRADEVRMSSTLRYVP